MQNSLNSVNPNMKFTPDSNTVVNPPKRVYKYSMYDELKLGEDKYKEIITALNKPSPSAQKERTQNILKNLLGIVIVAGLGILGYKNRNRIGEEFKKLKDKFN